MKKVLMMIFAVGLLTNSASAQKFYSKNANFSFNATADNSPEDIKAISNTSTVVIDAATGKVEASAQVKSFHFKRALMEQHFNENYVESGKFPKATFTGQIEGWKADFLKKDGNVNILIKGTMTIHGVSKNIEARGTVVIKGGAIVGGNTAFTLVLADYQISIPKQNANTINPKVKLEIKAENMKRM